MTTALRLVCASANPHKAAEIVAILGDAVDLLPRPPEVPEVVEDAPTLEGNARLKACALVQATGMAAVADDSGLEVDALLGAPGVRSARYAGDHARDADNVAKLLAELASRHGVPRTARFRTVAMVVFPDGSEIVATGSVEGVIAGAPRGDAGFGYDPVFVPGEGDGRTFAQLTPDEKHAISHRGRAFRALAQQLRAMGALSED
jgi:XTP/dITP diphosphohydrolase